MCTQIDCNNLTISLQNVLCRFMNPRVGSISYTTVALLPSNKRFFRVWNFQISGIFYPQLNDDQDMIVFDFSNVDYKNKQGITFEGPVQGTITIGKKCLYNSQEWIPPYGYYLDSEKNMLSFSILLSRHKTNKTFFINLFLNDTTPPLSPPIQTVYTLETYGRSGDGQSSNDDAWALMIQAIGSSNAVIFLNPGIYLFLQPLIVSLAAQQSISIIGGGMGISSFLFENNTGLQILYGNQFCSVVIQNMSFLAGQSNTGFGLQLQNPNTDPNPALSALTILQNVGFRGSDGFAMTNVFLNALNLFTLSNVNIISCLFVGNNVNQGYGIFLQGDPQIGNCNQINISMCTFSYGAVNIIYGRNTEGITISQCNFTGAQFAIQSPAGISGTGDQLAIFSNQFNCADVAINILSSINGISISNNYFIVFQESANYAIQMTGGVSTITGNSFVSTCPPSSANAIVLLPNCDGIFIVNNVFTGFNYGIYIIEPFANLTYSPNIYTCPETTPSIIIPSS